MQDFDRDVALEREVSGAVHPSEAAGPDLLEQFVVIAERAPQPALEPRFGHRRRGGGHLECAGIADEILEHFGRRVVAVSGSRGKSPDDHALDGRRYCRAQLARWFNEARVGIGRRAGEGRVDIRTHGVHVAGGIAGFGRSHLGRHVGRRGIVARGRLEVRQAPVRIAQIGNDALAAGVDHQRGRHDAAHDDAARVRMLQPGQQVPNQRHGLRNRARAAPQCVRKTFPLDPVGGAIGEAPHLSGGIYVPDSGVIQGRERLGLA